MNDSYENNNSSQQEPYPVNRYYEPPHPAEPQSSGMNSRKIIALAVGCSLLVDRETVKENGPGRHLRRRRYEPAGQKSHHFQHL